jgi:putative tricarboxylic transport membrane protein
MMERSLKQSLEISQGSFLIFLKSPIAVVFLALTALVLILPSLKFFRRSKEAMTGDEPA